MFTLQTRAAKARLAPTAPTRAPKPPQCLPRGAGKLTWDLCKTAVFAPNLAIGRVDDPLEEEADRIAEEITAVVYPKNAIAAAPLQLSRTCADCAEKDERLQKKAAPLSEPTAEYAPGVVHEAISSPGQPLEASARAYFEPRFAHDFSRVQIQCNNVADKAAVAVNAKAFTVGSHVVFAEGQYLPRTQAGKRLLAHELTHVVQQSGGRAPPSTIFASTAIVQRQIENPAEAMPAKTASPAEQDCGTGEVEGHVKICCMPHDRQHVKECDDLFNDVLFECWDKGPQDAHHLDVCGGRARFAECRCLAARLGPEHCKCSGLV